MCTPVTTEGSAPPAPPFQSGIAVPGAIPPDLTPEQILARYGDEIRAASSATGVPPEILAAMIWQESKDHPNTPGGGLLQLGPHEFAQYGGGDINNPQDNIMAGARYLQDMYEQFGSWDLALRAYNSGPNGVDTSNAHATPAGTGDSTCVFKVNQAASGLGFGIRRLMRCAHWTPT